MSLHSVVEFREFLTHAIEKSGVNFKMDFKLVPGRALWQYTDISRDNLVLLHVRPLLGNVLVNKFPQRQILGKQSVVRLRNNIGSPVFRVRGDVTTVGSHAVTCVSCRSDRRASRLAG
jgi:hypothetical protein